MFTLYWLLLFFFFLVSFHYIVFHLAYPARYTFLHSQIPTLSANCGRRRFRLDYNGILTRWLSTLVSLPLPDELRLVHRWPNHPPSPGDQSHPPSRTEPMFSNSKLMTRHFNIFIWFPIISFMVYGCHSIIRRFPRFLVHEIIALDSVSSIDCGFSGFFLIFPLVFPWLL